MQPNLALSYSSDGGSGWCGYGWNMAIPMITLDTRWGAPKFDPAHESEIYILNGQQLIQDDEYMPNRHSVETGSNGEQICDTGLKARQSGSTIFYERKLGSFSQITRNGNGLSEHNWEVITADGTRHIYGDTDNSRLLSKDLNGDLRGVSCWALTQSRDKYGLSLIHI